MPLLPSPASGGMETTRACTHGTARVLTGWLRANADCADVCDSTVRLLSWHAGYAANLTRAVLEACKPVR